MTESGSRVSLSLSPSSLRSRDQDMWVSPEIPLRRSDAASSTMIAVISLALRSSQPRTRCSSRVARSGDTASMMTATASGSSDTTEKNTHSTMYPVVLGVGLGDVLHRERDEAARVRECCGRRDDRDPR